MKRVRYAVVGLGHFAQSAILPAFEHAPNSELVAVISGDPTKRTKVPRAYQVPYAASYDEYDDFLERLKQSDYFRRAGCQEGNA